MSCEATTRLHCHTKSRAKLTFDSSVGPFDANDQSLHLSAVLTNATAVVGYGDALSRSQALSGAVVLLTTTVNDSTSSSSEHQEHQQAAEAATTGVRSSRGGILIPARYRCCQPSVTYKARVAFTLERSVFSVCRRCVQPLLLTARFACTRLWNRKMIYRVVTVLCTFVLFCNSSGPQYIIHRNNYKCSSFTLAMTSQ